MKRFVLGQFCLLFGAILPSWSSEIDDSWELLYEVFSMPLRDAAKLKRDALVDLQTYEQLVTMVTRGKVRQEKWMCLKIREGLNSWSKEVEEFRYQTECDYGDGLNFNPAAQVGGEELLLKDYWGFVNTLPLTIDCKEIGDHFDCELEKSEKGLMIRLSVSHVAYLRNDSFGKGAWKMEMPRFSVQSIKVTVEVNPGTPGLVGTLSPSLDFRNQGEGKRVWLAFLTVEKNFR